jgi:hypothetical protein
MPALMKKRKQHVKLAKRNRYKRPRCLSSCGLQPVWVHSQKCKVRRMIYGHDDVR